MVQIGVFDLKRVFISAVMACVTASMCTVQAWAAEPSITIRSEDLENSYVFVADNGEITAEAEHVFDNFEDMLVGICKKKNVSIAVDNKSESDVELVMQVSVEDNAAATVDYYDFKVTDPTGNIVYDSDSSAAAADGVSVKEISFGTFVSGNTTKEYTVEYKLDEAAYNTYGSNGAKNVYVSFISRADENADYSIEMVGKTVVDQIPEEPEAETVVASAETASSAAPSATPETVEAKEAITKVCGKDMSPGRYVVTGNGIVKVTDKDGKEEEVTVTDGSIAGIDGVKTCLVTLTEGATVSVLPLEGQDKPSVKFEKANTAATVAPTSSATVQPVRVTNAPAAPQKTNPKTGESTATVIACMLMVMAAFGVGVLEYLKRKKLKG